MLENARVLVTGGTGSFGQAFVGHLLTNGLAGELVVFSRDEFKQHEMAQRWPVSSYPIRYFLGDVRDKDRLLRAFKGVDYVVHAAALKQVPALEENPFEAVRTNILGAENIIEAALERDVRRVVAISTDKAVNSDQPVRRDEACHGEVGRGRQRICSLQGRPLFSRAIRQRCRQPRQCVCFYMRRFWREARRRFLSRTAQ